MQLSKTEYLLGHQCPEALWFSRHGARLGINRTALSPAEQLLVDQGHAVGQLAQQRFSGGVNLLGSGGFDLLRRASETKRLIDHGATVLFEPVFIHEDAVCAVDVLVRTGHNWCLFEVKAGTRVEGHHVLDAAFQYWILTRSGLDIAGVYVTHINNGYTRHGDLDLDQFFTDESVLDQVRSMQDEVTTGLEDLGNALLSDAPPRTGIGPHCSKPHACPFQSHCWQEIPARSVFELTRGGEKSWNLYSMGTVELRDIPDDFPLSSSQQIQVAAEKAGTAVIDHGAIRGFLNSLRYPIAHIDFETVAEAIPRYGGMRPYQQLPFQWSVHRQECEGGDIVHHEFLADACSDPREPFVTSLLAVLQDAQTVTVYNKGFEDGRLAELQDQFPHLHGEIQSVRDRLVDLMVPFQRKWYYTPEMHGSHSIKKVLPALVPELSYADLQIANGASASAAYVQLRHETDPCRIAQIRSQLLRYCERDTLAMVKVLERLQAV